MYNIRNKDCQEFFTENSSFNSNLLKVLIDKDIYRGGAKWMKEVQHLISKSFKKIRLTKSKVNLKSNLNELFANREKRKVSL